MVDCEKEEALNLVITQSIVKSEVMLAFLLKQKEFEWVLHQEVHKGLEQIHQILTVSYRSSPEVY
jgi:hypothetical protein